MILSKKEQEKVLETATNEGYFKRKEMIYDNERAINSKSIFQQTIYVDGYLFLVVPYSDFTFWTILAESEYKQYLQKEYVKFAQHVNREYEKEIPKIQELCQHVNRTFTKKQLKGKFLNMAIDNQNRKREYIKKYDKRER